MDLITPTDHATPYEWAAVLFAHALIGLFLTSLLRWVVAFFRGRKNDQNGNDHFNYPSFWVAALIAASLYFVAWEGAVQWFGAGFRDAIIDTAAILAGGLLAAASWARNGMAIIGISAIFLCGAAIEILTRPWKGKDT